MRQPFRIVSGTALVAAALAGGSAAAETLENWPCAGCFTHVPGGARSPSPLLVALHGDGGGVRRVFHAWKAACEAAGVILVAPRCPLEAGCRNGSFWQWFASVQHDPAWLGAQIDAVTSRFTVDPARIYATGYSGGATYLGYYGPTNPRRFAAIAHIAGGMPYGVPCPSCKIPVLFVIGPADPMVVPFTRPLRAYYERCGGHEVVWESLPGVTHEGILDVLRAGRAKRALDWLLARPAACALPASGPVTMGPDAAAGSDAAEEDAGPATEAPDAALSPSTPARSGVPRPLEAERLPPGCACEVVGDGTTNPVGACVALGSALMVWRSRRRPPRQSP